MLLRFLLSRTLCKDCLDTSYFPAQEPQSARLFQLATLLLHTKMKTLLTEISLLRQQLVRSQFRHLFKFHNWLGCGDMVPGQKLSSHRQFIRCEAK